jgi:GNAT superfamily N-acetyltransferase
MDYLIRNCAKKDVKAVVSLCKKHAEYEQALYDSKNKVVILKQILFAKKPKLFCLVVEADKRIIGYATYTFDCSTWDAATFIYMDCLYLESEYRGFKIGEALMLQLVEIAKAHNCINIQWQTPDFNERAIKFYKRIGAVGKNKMRFFMDTQ